MKTAQRRPRIRCYIANNWDPPYPSRTVVGSALKVSSEGYVGKRNLELTGVCPNPERSAPAQSLRLRGRCRIGSHTIRCGTQSQRGIVHLYPGSVLRKSLLRTL